jgi:hypothetical protein
MVKQRIRISGKEGILLGYEKEGFDDASINFLPGHQYRPFIHTSKGEHIFLERGIWNIIFHTKERGVILGKLTLDSFDNQIVFSYFGKRIYVDSSNKEIHIFN